MHYILMLLGFVTFALAQPYNNVMIKQIKNIKGTNKSFSFAVYGDNRGRDDILVSIIKSVDLVSYGFEFMFEHYLSLIQKQLFYHCG